MKNKVLKDRYILDLKCEFGSIYQKKFFLGLLCVVFDAVSYHFHKSHRKNKIKVRSNVNGKYGKYEEW